jgi:hypothetical protein
MTAIYTFYAATKKMLIVGFRRRKKPLRASKHKKLSNKFTLKTFLVKNWNIIKKLIFVREIHNCCSLNLPSRHELGFFQSSLSKI